MNDQEKYSKAMEYRARKRREANEEAAMMTVCVCIVLLGFALMIAWMV